jgi:small subunit ribosomal protein S13
MFTIINKTIYPKKNALITLKQIYGINTKLASTILKYCGLQNQSKLNTLASDSIAMAKLKRFIRLNENFFENNLRLLEAKQVQHLVTIKSYRGLRHSLGYPVRGQRTHTNANTLFGKHKAKSSTNNNVFKKAQKKNMKTAIKQIKKRK